jgi:5-formyltetrahydrofolate cyclo-ligase
MAFLELDRQRPQVSVVVAPGITGDAADRAARHEELPSIDLVVRGSVAVAREGARLGKGGGYADLEFGVPAMARKVVDRTPIVTTVHRLPISEDRLPMHPHDIPVDLIATPEAIIWTRPAFRRATARYWGPLAAERLAAAPVPARARPSR